MNTRAKNLLRILIIILIGGILLWPIAIRNIDSDRATETFSSEEQNVHSVKLIKAKEGRLQQYLEISGDVVADANVDVYPDTGGKVVSVHSKIGENVTKGITVIAEIDPSKPGSSYSVSPVYSPISGTVTSLTAQPGATVTAATSLGTVGLLGNLLVDAAVPETNIAGLRLGLKAEITFDAYPDQIFSATIERISPVIDPVSRTKKIRLKFLDGDSRINAGMFAGVKLLYDPRPKNILIPESAGFMHSGKACVFVVDGEMAHRCEVILGENSDGLVEIQSGLKPGANVVVKGHETLDEGTLVRELANDAEDSQ